MAKRRKRGRKVVVDSAGGMSLLEEGMYPVELVEIRDIETDYGDSLRWIFSVFEEEDEDGEIPEVSGITSIRFSAKSKAYRWASALLGYEPDVGEEIDLDDLIGERGLGELKTGTLRDGTEVSNLVDLKPLPKKVKKPAREEDVEEEEEERPRKRTKKSKKKPVKEELEEEELEDEEWME